jgi:hypothetical protein
MTISLVSVLRTGSFGTLVGGQSPGEVVAALGEPDAVGGTSGNHRSPSIFLYGTVELWFDRRPPFGLTGVWWEPGETREFRFSYRCDIADWAFGPLWARSRVEKYLEDAGIAFADSPGAPDSISDRVIALANGVRLSFDDGLLYGLHVALV